jgi:hypothetical protein
VRKNGDRDRSIETMMLLLMLDRLVISILQQQLVML